MPQQLSPLSPIDPGMLADARMISVAKHVSAFTAATTLTLDSQAQVEWAVLRGTAHGIFEARIDDTPVSAGVLAPGWSAYKHRLPVEEYDITPLVRDGAALEVLVGNGWWRGDLGFGDMAVGYGDRIGFMGEVEIAFADGTNQRIVTGEDWTAQTAAITDNSLYDGVHIDPSAARHALDIVLADVDRRILVPQRKPATERQQVLQPQRIWTSPSGKTLVDFGQNVVGWTRLRCRGAAGAEVVLRHAEVLEHGELGTRPLARAKATDTFVLTGGDDEFEPTLTYHGFRYVEVSGFPGRLDFSAIDAIVVHTRMRRTGSFECSDESVNRFVENSIWSQRGNFLSLPTDCPQRNERLGWTGDISVYAPTACYQFDCAALLDDWLRDLRAEAAHAGHVPFIVPNIFDLIPEEELGFLADIHGPTAVWGDAAVWVPEALWWAYGDADRLAEQYTGIVLHLESVLPLLTEEGRWESSYQLGDWLDPTAPRDRPMDAKANPDVIATACLYRSARFAAAAAQALGYEADHQRWQSLAERTRDAFRRGYVQDDGRIVSNSQTVYALAIHFDLLDDDERHGAGRRLAELVEEGRFRVATGFAGTPYVVWALTETGHVDAAYRLLLQDEMPSWLYPVTMGATTTWERWDSMLPDGSINPSGMTSFNHYAFGAMADWLYKRVAGIQPAEPGYRRVRFQPTPGPGLTWARGTLDTPHGRVECGWREDASGVIVVDCVVPDGVDADLVLPDGRSQVLGAGTHRVVVPSER